MSTFRPLSVFSWRRQRTFILNVLITIFVLVAWMTPLSAQLEAPADSLENPGIAAPSPTDVLSDGNAIDGYPVFLAQEQLFLVRTGVPGVATAEERAEVIRQRILKIAADPQVSLDSIHWIEQNSTVVVMAGDTILFTILEDDEVAYQASLQVLGDTAVEQIQIALQKYRQERSLNRLIWGIVSTVISTIALLIFLRSVLFFISKSLLKIAAARDAQSLSLRFNKTQILGENAMGYLLSGLLRLLRAALVFLGLYIYIPFVLSQFPATEVLGDSVLQDIAYRINLLTQRFVGYLPSLAILFVIGLIAYYFIGFIEKVIIELGRPDLYRWFYPEWVQPTIRLMTFLVVAIACVVAGPYLPGFGSPAFQGISLFVGALLTLGSSSAVSNVISGIILIYTRAFQLNDFICIGETIGNVNEKSLFVTRILTPKKEVVTIPNLSVLNSNVINYSAICRESNGQLVLHTTITLGYDVPWRQVHEVLMAAAAATEDILSVPQPFVLQTGLNDFNVSYELNAYTHRPDAMAATYSALHQNIQDHCNQANIEILSPTFSALRDGNPSTIPAQYLPKDYTPPVFSIKQHSSEQQSSQN